MTLPERRPGSTRSRPPSGAPAVRPPVRSRRSRRRRPPGCDRPRPTTVVLAVAGLAQPAPQGAARQRAVARAPPPRVSGSGRSGSPGSSAVPPRRAARRPGGPATDGIATGHLRAQRQELVADPVADEGRVVVALVTGRREAGRGAQGVGLAPAQPEDRVPGPGAMPASPSAPAPRNRFTRIVSAWSSMVCPVATSAGSTAKRAGAGLGLEVGPGGDGDTMALEPRAEPLRRRRTTSASPAEPARKPWSTWIAVTSHPAPAASTRRASESAPPETAQASGAPGGGKVHRLRRSGMAAEGRAGPSSATGPSHPGRRVADLLEGGQPVGALPDPGQQRGPPAASTDSTKRSPSAYWRILASRPSSFDISLVSPFAWVRRSCSTWEKCAAPGTSAAPPGPWSRRRALRAGSSSPRSSTARAAARAWPACRSRRRPGSDCARPAARWRRAAQLGQPRRVTRERPEQLRHQSDEVVAQPGHRRELQPWVTSCSASHRRNSLGSNPYWASTATMLGPT